MRRASEKLPPVATAKVSSLFAQKMRDMNISTSFISDAEDPESSTDEIISGCPIDSRQSVLEILGNMLDLNLLTESEAQQAVCLAMKTDNTYELMGSLLRARSASIQAQSVFIKMWLRGFREDTKKPAVKVLQRVTSQKAIPIETVNPSPPLMPLSLHFSSDESSPLESPIAERLAPTPSILLSEPFLGHFKKNSSSTASTLSPSPQLILTNMLAVGRGESTSSDDCGV